MNKESKVVAALGKSIRGKSPKRSAELRRKRNESGWKW